MTPNRFIIYATPRSGSAWLSNFFTTGNALCIHEALGTHSPIEVPSLLEGREHGGICDTYAYEVRAELSALGWKQYALIRDKEGVEASCEELELPCVYEPQLDLPTIEYEKLFDVDYLEAVWGIVIGPGFDRQRAEQLIEMRVERDLEALGKRMESNIWLMSRY